MNPFALPQITTPGPIFNLPTSTAQTPIQSSTQRAVERKKNQVESVADLKSDAGRYNNF
jgi:hypothetical protein